MMNVVVLLVAGLCLVQSQRPPYAGTSNRYPVVLPQFLDGKENTGASGTIANRIDADGMSVSGGPAVAAAPGTTVVTSTIPPDLPVDALGNVELVNRIKTWPKEMQPFWFLNWQAIQAHRGDANNRAAPVAVQPNTRSFFAG